MYCFLQILHIVFQENRHDDESTAAPTPIKLQNLYPHTIPTISFQSKSPEKKASADIKQGQKCSMQNDPDTETNIDLTARSQLQHRKDLFANPFEDVGDGTRTTTFQLKANLPTPNIRKSNPSAFTIVSPSRQGLHPSHTVTSVSQPLAARNLHSFNSTSSNVHKPCSGSINKDSLQLSVQPSNYEQKTVYHLPSKTQRIYDSNKSSIQNTNDLHRPFNESLLSDIPEEERLNQSLDIPTTHTNHSLPLPSCQGVSRMAEQAQTLYFALPQHVNVQQFSNQTLNLDLGSQHLLQSLLQLSSSQSTEGDDDQSKFLNCVKPLLNI